MKAIILAAGQGTRLRPITENIPKILVEVERKPILAHQIEALKSNDITDIVICTGHCAERIVEYCQKHYPNLNFSFVHNPDYLKTNNMYSLYLAREHMNDDFFLMNGDVVFEKTIIAGMLQNPGSFIATDIGRYIGESMKIVVDERGVIKDISKKIEKTNAYGSSIDVYKFEKKFAPNLIKSMQDFIENKKDLNQWTEVMLQRLAQGGEIEVRPYDIQGASWWEIDDHQDLEIARNIFNVVPYVLSKKKVFFLDGDGTLFLGNTKINGADKFLETLERNGQKIFILSNNSSKTPEDYVNKLNRLGFSVTNNQILLPTDNLMAHLKEKSITNIFLLANASVEEYFKSNGFTLTEKDPQAVVLTYDTEVTYDKLKKASLFLHGGVPYLATHIDIVCPTENGPIPDIGTFIDTFEKTTDRRPDKTFGKPSGEMVMPTLERLGLNVSDAVVIGDRLYTDIRMGKDANILSILVLSGETTDDDIKSSDIKPDMVVLGVERLIRFLDRE